MLSGRSKVISKAFAADADPSKPGYGCGAKLEHQIVSSQNPGHQPETSAVVHGCDGRPDDSAASRGIYGKENGATVRKVAAVMQHGLSP